MIKLERNQILAISFFIFGLLFQYIRLDNIAWLPERIAHSGVILKGISFVLLSNAAILSRVACKNKQLISLI